MQSRARTIGETIHASRHSQPREGAKRLERVGNPCRNVDGVAHGSEPNVSCRPERSDMKNLSTGVTPEPNQLLGTGLAGLFRFRPDWPSRLTRPLFAGFHAAVHFVGIAGGVAFIAAFVVAAAV